MRLSGELFLNGTFVHTDATQVPYYHCEIRQLYLKPFQRRAGVSYNRTVM